MEVGFEVSKKTIWILVGIGALVLFMRSQGAGTTRGGLSFLRPGSVASDGTIYGTGMTYTELKDMGYSDAQIAQMSGNPLFDPANFA